MHSIYMQRVRCDPFTQTTTIRKLYKINWQLEGYLKACGYWCLYITVFMDSTFFLWIVPCPQKGSKVHKTFYIGLVMFRPEYGCDMYGAFCLLSILII